MLSSHQKRLLTAAILLASLAVVISLGGWPLRIAVLLVSILGLIEFFNLYWPSGIYRGRRCFGLALGGLAVLSQALDPLWTVAVLGLAFAGTGMLFLWEYGRGNTGARLGHYSPILHGLLYVPLILQLALYLTPAEQCLALAAAIASDTGGYYAGSWFGGKKLWPLVSPKKTWAGFFGGMAACVAVCVVMGALSESMNWRMLQMPVWAWLLMGLALHQAALFGDLFESALKRSLEVKDSGSLLPGHGGILDRIDSLLFVLPVFLILRQIIRFL